MTPPQILVNDLSTFLLIFLLVFCTFGTVLLIIYPEGQPLAPQFEEVSTALTGMIQLAFTGEPLTLNMSAAMWDEVQPNPALAPAAAAAAAAAAALAPRHRQRAPAQPDAAETALQPEAPSTPHRRSICMVAVRGSI